MAALPPAAHIIHDGCCKLAQSSCETDAPVPRVSLVSLHNNLRRELPGSEGTAIQMDEFRAGIHPHSTVLQRQCSMAHVANFDAGNIEVERLSLDVQAVLRDSPAPLHEQRIVLRGPIAGNHMDFASAIDRFLHEIHMFQHSHIDGGHFSRVMTTQNVVHFIQRDEVVIAFIVAILDP